MLTNEKPMICSDEDIFIDPLTETRLNKYKIPKNSSSSDVVEEMIKEELMLDGNAKQNMATFCTTWADKSIHNLMDLCIDKNMIDKDEYPQTAELEKRCVHMIADLWNSPESENTIGCSTTGSSEAAMLGGLAMKRKWSDKRKNQGKDFSKPNIVVGPVQICWHKFARYFDVELRRIPLDGDEVAMNPEKLKDYVDENTIGVVATLGVTYTCVYEDVMAIAKELDEIEKMTGLDIPIHVDGASGGFIAPFVQEDLVWDFRIERVKSINASGHKYGLAPLGVGWVVWRTENCLPENLIFYVDYLGGNMPTFALNFSRPGGQIVAQYYNFIHLGFEGYKKIQQACMDTAAWLADEIKKIDDFELFYDGRGGLPALSYKMKSDDLGYNLYDLSECLRLRGWQIASYPLPSNRGETVIQRIMIRHGFSRDLAGLLLDDIKKSVYKLKNSPLNNGQKNKASSVFSHI